VLGDASVPGQGVEAGGGISSPLSPNQAPPGPLGSREMGGRPAAAPWVRPPEQPQVSRPARWPV